MESDKLYFQPAPLVIAHRGAADEVPENTLPAFEMAIQRGADGIEFDVRLTADGVPVVIHDARLERTTSGFGLVGDLPLKALRKLDAGAWFNRRYPGKSSAGNAGLRVPLLAEVLALVRRLQCQAWLEIKGGGKVYPGVEAKVLEEIARAGVAPLTSVISFNVAALRRCRELDSTQALGISFTRPPLVIRKAGLMGAVSVLPHGVFTSERFIARAHAAELKVVTWGLELQGPMRRRMLSGADGLITWSPGKAVKLRDQIQNEMARSRVRV